MRRFYSTLLTPPEIHALKPSPKVLAARVKLLQRIIPAETPITLTQASYCLYPLRHERIPTYIIPTWTNEHKYVTQRSLSDLGYELLCKQIDAMIADNTLADFAIPRGYLISKLTLAHFLRQFHRLVSQNALGYKGASNRVDIGKMMNMESTIPQNDEISIDGLPPVEIHGVKQPVKVYARERHRILTTIIGMVALVHPQKVNDFIKDWIILGKAGHDGLVDICTKKMKGFQL